MMRRNTILKGVLLSSLFVMTVSCGQHKPGPETPLPVYGDSELYMTVPIVELADNASIHSKAEEEGQTKASMEENDKGLRFVWSKSDAIAIVTEEGSAKHQVKEAAKNSASFQAGATLAPGTSCKAFYPYDAFSEPSPILDFRAPAISSNGSKSGLYSPLYASSAINPSGGAKFEAKHLGAFGFFGLDVPVNGQLSSFSLVPFNDEVPLKTVLDLSDASQKVKTSVPALRAELENISTSSKNRTLKTWLSFAPHDYSSQNMAAVVEDAYGGLYSLSLDGKNFQAGRLYAWEGNMIEYSNSEKSTLTVTTDLSNISSIQKNISNMGVPFGQFSGITHVEGSRYAIAHDQARGGGIYFLDLQFDSKGNVTAASQEIPEATQKGAASRDVEGIVYLPSSKTFLTCGETNQDILEYDIEGKPTGRKLEIPEDMASASLCQNNQGFESLAYNSKTGLIWTTTEAPLEKDKELFNKNGRLIRLQSFKEDFSAGQRFLYLIDKPEIENEINSATYGYGVSDMLALDDGKLIVMEREVYVNISKLNVWCKVRLYLVDPVNDKGGILNKSLLASFKTSSGALADYEGMCEGPVLSDGSKTILLICDSAGGKAYSAFHLSDYILTIVYR